MRARRAASARLPDRPLELACPAALEDWFDGRDWFANMNEHPEETTQRQRELVKRVLRSALAERPGGRADARRSLLSRQIGQRRSSTTASAISRSSSSGAAILVAELVNVERLVIPGAGGFPLWESPDHVIPAVAALPRGVNTARRNGRPGGNPNTNASRVLATYLVDFVTTLARLASARRPRQPLTSG